MLPLQWSWCAQTGKEGNRTCESGFAPGEASKSVFPNQKSVDHYPKHQPDHLYPSPYNIPPLVSKWFNPSTNFGWSGNRKKFYERLSLENLFLQAKELQLVSFTLYNGCRVKGELNSIVQGGGHGPNGGKALMLRNVYFYTASNGTRRLITADSAYTRVSSIAYFHQDLGVDDCGMLEKQKEDPQEKPVYAGGSSVVQAIEIYIKNSIKNETFLRFQRIGAHDACIPRPPGDVK